MKLDLEKVTLELEHLIVEERKDKLIHQVYFSLKSNLESDELDQFMEGLKKLGTIEVVKDILVEKRENVGDEARALIEFDIMMQLTFDNQTALKQYAKNNFHATIKREIGGFLTKPPMTFDYVVD